MQFKNIGKILSAGDNINKLIDVVKDIGNLENAASALKSVKNISDDLKIESLKYGLSGIDEAAARTALGIASVGDASTVTSSKLSNLGSALKGAFSTFIKSPAGIVTAIAAVTAGVVALFEYIDVTADESREAMLSMQSDYDSTKSEIESLNSELETKQDRIDELLRSIELEAVIIIMKRP